MTAELLAAIRLASPSLPVGAFAYSGGLESAVELGWVRDKPSAEAWVVGLLHNAVARFDLPLLARLWRATAAGDTDAFTAADAWVLAGREAAELRAEERHLGEALTRLQVATAPSGGDHQPAARSYVAAFASAAVTAGIGEPAALGSYAFAWLEHQVSAAVRLVPLGQTDGQRVLGAGLRDVPALVELARGLPADDIGTSTPGLAIASARHETQHTRLFRS